MSELLAGNVDDSSALTLVEESDAYGLTAYIHTSDSALFKQCRRQWNWFGKLGEQLEADEQPWYFWFGTGIHYAMEDFHGRKFYNSASDAFRAYTIACRRTRSSNIPAEWRELVELAVGMLDYYEMWLVGKDQLQTLWFEGFPQCEVTFDIPLPFDFSQPRYAGSPYSRVVYRGTIDRVVHDSEYPKRLWLLDYKTVGSFSSEDFDLNAQASRYCWAASVLYPGYEIAGFVFQEHRKEIAKPPKLLGSGKYSTNKQQLTTYKLYRKALKDLYVEERNFPRENAEFLTSLAEQEGEERDRFIKRTWTPRNLHRISAEGTKIMLEVEDMLDPNLPKYPSPSKDCTWRCPGRAACLALDDGHDWEQLLADVTHKKASAFKPHREQEIKTWRNNLPDPEQLPELLHLAQ